MNDYLKFLGQDGEAEDLKFLHHMAKRVLHFTPKIKKMSQLDILFYVRQYENLEWAIDHYSFIITVCNCHKVEIVFIEDEYDHDSYLLSRMFNFGYSTGVGFPPEAITSNVNSNIAMLGLIAEGNECPRCWNMHEGDGLCQRCDDVIITLD